LRWLAFVPTQPGRPTDPRQAPAPRADPAEVERILDLGAGLLLRGAARPADRA